MSSVLLTQIGRMTAGFRQMAPASHHTCSKTHPCGMSGPPGQSSPITAGRSGRGPSTIKTCTWGMGPPLGMTASSSSTRCLQQMLQLREGVCVPFCVGLSTAQDTGVQGVSCYFVWSPSSHRYRMSLIGRFHTRSDVVLI